MNLALGVPFTWPDLERGVPAVARTQTTAPEKPAFSAPGQAGVWAALEVSLTPPGLGRGKWEGPFYLQCPEPAAISHRPQVGGVEPKPAPCQL